MTWFTLFFIPVFPYSIKYFLSCPICQYGLTLDDKQTEQIKPIAEANQLLIGGKITEADYQTKINQLGSGTPTQVDVEIVEPKSLSDGDEKLSFCPKCGAKSTKKIKFCGNYRAKVFEK